MTKLPSASIAIVGMAALFPGSVDKDGFWRDIVAGKDLITDVPPTHWLIDDYYDPDPKARDKTYARRGAFLSDVDFDPVAWGVPPALVPSTDTTQLLALVVAQKVLEDAWGTRFSTMPRDRVSVILGVTSAQELLGSMVSRLQRPVWERALRETGLREDQVVAACEKIAGQYVEWQESTFPGVLGNVVAGRIANRLDLGGTNCVTDAACASSFSALSMAVAELRLGESDLVIAGGADTMNDIFMYVCFSKTPALSATGDCRPFSDRADGTMLGEGLGMVALKRLEDAERDGDRVYAVIRGVGASSDGRAKSVYAPVAAGQAKALRRAYEQAGYGPGTVGLVEAHGTGTRAGDAAEFEGLRMVFDESGRSDRGWCALGSVKSQIGHTKAASGAAGLFKAVMALHHRVLPPSIKIDRPDPKLDIDASPFHLNTVARPWVRAGHPRRASVSSFGFGGSNFHITLEEYDGPARRPARVRPAGGETVLFGAATAQEIAATCRSLAVDAGRDGMLVFLARSTQLAFDASSPARLAIYAESGQDLADKLVQAAELVERDAELSMPGGIEFGKGAREGELAFLFPGQGSQYLGMSADLVMALPSAQRSWDRSAEVALGADEMLADVVFPRPSFDDVHRAENKARLTATEWSQPAIAATSLAQLAVLRDLGLSPDVVAGHSFGELTALCVAGVLEESDLVRAARRRGELMAEAARTPGGMISVAAAKDRIESVLPGLGADLVIANYNTPNQHVLSGAVEAIAIAEKTLAAAGLVTTRLDVATAFHSPLVAAACSPWRAFLAGLELGEPVMDVYANETAAPYASDAESIRDQLGRQLVKPVRFVEQIEAMYARGVRTFVEVGPGRVLSSLVTHILKKRPHRVIALDRKGRAGLGSLSQALGALSAAGVALRYDALWADFDEVADPRARPAQSLVLKLNGANYGKLYPPKGNIVPAPVVPVAPASHAATGAVAAPVPVAAPPVAAAPVAAAAHVDPNVQLAWVQAFQESQRHTAEAHAAFQRASAESHAAFLRSADASLASLAAILGASPPLASTTAAALSNPAPLPMAAPVKTPMPVAMPAPVPVAMPAPPARTTAVAAPVARAPKAAVPLDAAQLTAVMLAIVAEKTGYPAEILGLDMDLEADLGVDSIKRVEILSAAVERAPGLPELNASKMATLRTLRQIIGHLEKAVAGSPSATVAPARVATAAPPVEPAASLPSADELRALMLAIVAEKTGYPAEILGLDMDLEADLGVDSIKRVEILSAAVERAPGLPELNASKMATLRTLRQIVDHLDRTLRGDVRTAPVLTAGAKKSLVPSSAVQRHALAMEPARALGLVTPGLLGARRLVVTEDGLGVAAALVTRLRARGANAVLVDAVPLEADGAIFLGGLRVIDDVDAALAIERSAFEAARALAARCTESGGTFITVQDTDGDFGIAGSSRAWLAGIVALARTAALEWPRAVVRALDVERGKRSADDIAAAIEAELLEGGVEREVGLRADGARSIPKTRAMPVATPSAPCFERSGVVVVSGGARGVTAACVVALARAAGGRYLLLGRSAHVPEPDACRGVADADLKRALLADAQRHNRTPTPIELGKSADAVRATREIERTLEALRVLGSEARYVAVDVTHTDEVRAALESARAEWGPIVGVVHAAGVLADKLIADKTDAQWTQVFDTKVAGLRVLLAATADDALSFLTLFSSVAARHGNPGQVDYAMANEVLNKVAVLEQHRRGASCVVRALGWGPWDGGMVDEALRDRFTQRGVPLIALAAGAQAFVDEIGSSGSDVEIVLGGAPAGLAGREHPVRAVTAEIFVDRATHPFLDGHRVRGAAVVPAALVVEWFARAARACRPDLVLVACRELKVLRGVRLAGFDGAGDRYVVRATQRSNGNGALLALELLSSDGAPGAVHYTALCEMKERVPAAPRGREHDAAHSSPWNAPIYDGEVLFHGASFRAIREVEGISELGMTAVLDGAADHGWPGDWQLDPLLLDAGLQLALLWASKRLGGASLPTSIGAVHVYERGLVRGPVRCVLSAGEAAHGRCTSHVAFQTEDGRVLAELVGVEVHVLPKGLPAEPVGVTSEAPV